jgi:hypothetical protein
MDAESLDESGSSRRNDAISSIMLSAFLIRPSHSYAKTQMQLITGYRDHFDLITHEAIDEKNIGTMTPDLTRIMHNLIGAR